MTDEVAALASAIQQSGSSNVTPATIVQGVVVTYHSATTPPTVDLTLSGSSTVVPTIQFMSPYSPTVGDTVQVLRQGSSSLVLGQTQQTPVSSSVIVDWYAPPLATSITTEGGGCGPLMVRMISEFGALKVQVKGSVTISGGASGAQNLFTLYGLGSGQASPPAFDRLIPCVTNTSDESTGLLYIRYDSSDGIAHLIGGDSTTSCAILDGHEFFVAA